MARDTGSDSETMAQRVRRWLPYFAGAVVVRVLYWALVVPRYKARSDADQYIRISKAIADGHGYALIFPQLEFHATAFRPPLYPLLLTPGSLLFGDAVWPARLLNVLLGAVVVVLAGMLATRLAGRLAGRCTAIIVALYPPLIANDAVTLTEPLALALLLGAILLLDDDRWVWGGLAMGGLLLTRPNGYFVLLILMVWAWRKAGVRQAGVVLGCSMALLVPWMVRNQIQVGTWRPTTSDGFTLAATYGKPAQDAGNFVDPVFSPAYDDADHRFAQFDEAAWNEKLTREAIDALKDNPGYLAHLISKNTRGYFELEPSLNRYPEREDGRNWRFRQAMLPVFFLVTIAGLVGLVRELRARRDERLVVLLVVVAQFVVLSLVLVAPPRLRAPFDLAMCLGAGLLVASLIDARRAGASSSATLDG